jgi:hypothetical protein
VGREVIWGEKLHFFFDIVVDVCGQLCAPATLATGRYSPVGLAV